MLKKLTSIILSLAIILTCGIAACADKATVTFSDVDASTALGTAIYKLVRAGVINGFEDGTFRSADALTRAQLCKMVNLIWGFTEKSTETFADVTEDKWYYTQVLIGKKAGYINGFEDGTFRGESYVTREQVCAILCRIATLNDVLSTQTVTDTVSPWAAQYVNKIIGNKLIPLEKGNTFRATENMKRGELAIVLATFVKETPSGGSTGGSTGGNTGGSTGGNTGGNAGGNTGGDVTPPPVDYTAENAAVVANINVAISQLVTNRELFTNPEKEIVDTVVSVLNKVVAGQSEYKISTSKIYEKHSDEILLALDKYAAMDASGRGSFVSKLSQLNSDVFNFLQEFFGVNFEDIEEGLQSEEQ